MSATAIREVAQKYLVEAIEQRKTATAVLGEKTPFYDEKTWKVMPVSVDLGGAAVEDAGEAVGGASQ